MAPYRGSGNTRRVEIREPAHLDTSATEEIRSYVRVRPANEQARFRREGRTRRSEEPYIESYPETDSTSPSSNMPFRPAPYTTYNGYYSHQGLPAQPHSYQVNPLVSQYSVPYGGYYAPAPGAPRWGSYGAYDPNYAPAVPRYIEEAQPDHLSPVSSDSGHGDAVGPFGGHRRPRSSSSGASVAGSSAPSVEQEATRMKRQIRRMKQENQNAKLKEEIRRDLTRHVNHEVSRLRRETDHAHARDANPMRPRTNNIQLVKRGHGSGHSSRRDKENMVREILDIVGEYGYERRYV